MWSILSKCNTVAITDWDAERMWRTYVLLADLEAMFRSLKSESLLFDRYPTAAQLRRLVRRSVDLLRYSFPG